MIIRHASVDDIGAVCALWKELVEHQRTYDDRIIMNDQNEARFMDYLNGLISEGHCLVADTGDGIVGYVLFAAESFPFEIKYESAAISDMYVREGSRGRGIGEALLEGAAAQLSEEGFSRVRLYVFSDNEPARRFYERHGFSEQMDILLRDL